MPISDSVEIKIEDPGQADVFALIEAADAYYADLYPPENNHLLDIAALRKPEATFLVARLGGRVVGYGALVRHAEGYGEIKRMFVDTAARGRRIGRRLVERLEDVARAASLDLVRLETGTRQPEAIALYRAAGYGETGPFGAYPADPLSLFMEKRLGSGKIGSV